MVGVTDGVGRLDDAAFIQQGGSVHKHIAIVGVYRGHKAALGPTGWILHGVIEIFLSESDLKAVEPLIADLFTKTVDACLGGIRILSNGGDGAGNHCVGIVDDILSDLVFADSQGLLHGHDLGDDGRIQGPPSPFQ